MSEVCDLGHWAYKDTFISSDYKGFVYQITNQLDGRIYIGQKQFHSAIKRKPLKGKKRVRRDTKESNWRTYTGSSKALNADIEEYGIESFTFEVLQLCNSKWDLNYAELKAIIDNDALRRNDFYNEYVGRIGRCPQTSKY